MQCLDSNDIKSLGSDWSVTKPAPTEDCPKYVADGQQCGGRGGACEAQLGVCRDARASSVCCEPGSTCVRQNEYYYGCQKK